MLLFNNHSISLNKGRSVPYFEDQHFRIIIFNYLNRSKLLTFQRLKSSKIIVKNIGTQNIGNFDTCFK